LSFFLVVSVLPFWATVQGINAAVVRVTVARGSVNLDTAAARGATASGGRGGHARDQCGDRRASKARIMQPQSVPGGAV
jgi:hypothetical protein